MDSTPTIARNFLDAVEAPEPVLPEVLTRPLAERLRLIEQGDLQVEEWRAQANNWAFAADARYRACVDLRSVSPHAPPIRLGVKDTVDVAGFPTRLGLRRYRHYPRRSAAPLRAVRRSSVIAKVVTTELNIGVGSGCVNPYFPHVSPAGSSTGSGVAVAANICDVSLGTDVLGSVRWPAGRCGVVGLRTTHDPAMLDGVFPLCPPMDAAGWVARTADDLGFAWARLGLGRVAEPGSQRIAVVEDVFEGGGCDEEVVAALEVAAAALKDAGHVVGRVRLGDLWNCRGPAWELCARDAWEGYQVWGERLRDDLHESTMAALNAGVAVSPERYAVIKDQLLAHRARLLSDRQTDFWLVPLDPTPPQPIGHRTPARSTIPEPGDTDYDDEIGYTPLASFAGLPAITFPVNLSAEHRTPIAAQLVGPADSEGTLIRLAEDLAHVLAAPVPRPR